MEKTNNEFIQLPLGESQKLPVTTTPPPIIDQDLRFVVEREVPAEYALSQATVQDLYRIGSPWRQEIVQLKNAGFVERAKTEPGQPRSVELKAKDGSTLRFETTYTEIAQELERKLQEAADREGKTVEELRKKFDYFDRTGSVPTGPVSNEIAERKRLEAYLRDDT